MLSSNSYYLCSIFTKIDLIATDSGRPHTLQSRITLTLIVVDSSNNAVQFDKMHICLSGGSNNHNFQCDTYFQSLIINLKEEQTNANIEIPAAKMNDITKKDDEICYYLSGEDREYFLFDSKRRILHPIGVLDHERKSVYEVFITASEYCNCTDLVNITNYANTKNNGYVREECSFIIEKMAFDLNDVTQLMVRITLEDVNDNVPEFAEVRYQVGVTSDVEFNEVILESYVSYSRHLFIKYI